MPEPTDVPVRIQARLPADIHRSLSTHLEQLGLSWQTFILLQCLDFLSNQETLAQAGLELARQRPPGRTP